MESYDIIIIGTGPAGLSAAIYCARANLKTLVIGSKDKSHLAMAHRIENYLGFTEGIDGKELLDKAISQAERFKAVIIDEEVTGTVKQDNIFIVKTSKAKDFSAKALIIATGMALKSSGVKGESEFLGKGVSYCVVCDGYFFQDKNVAIIGSGNYAAEEALETLAYTKDISIFSQGKEFQIDKALMKKLSENNIKLRKEKVESFEGSPMLQKLALSNGKKEDFDGVFIAVGTASALSIATKLGLLTEGNALKIDRDGKTSMKGVFAAGDCTGGELQVSKAVGEGCNAALSCIKFITGKQAYADYSKK